MGLGGGASIYIYMSIISQNCSQSIVCFPCLFSELALSFGTTYLYNFLLTAGYCWILLAGLSPSSPSFFMTHQD